jgi:nitrate reductase gamma subunit
MSDFLRILENEVQIVALAFLGTVYILRLVWMFKFKSSKERTFPAGNKNTAIAYSMLNVAMPWAMESIRKNPFFYIQFVIFHLGVIAAIGATFIIPYYPELFKIKAVVLIFQAAVGAACIVGLIRLYRRMTHPSIKMISTIDDYFSLIMMILFFAAGFFAIPNNYQTSESALIIFFVLTTFFLFYVPFSKISHYLYYPFTRFFLGRTLGHRGIIFKKKHDESD